MAGNATEYRVDEHLSPDGSENIEMAPSPLTVSPASSKRSMHWPFSSSISTSNSPIEEPVEQIPSHIDPNATLRRFASTRQNLRYHRSQPSSLLRLAKANAQASGNLNHASGKGHRQNPSVSTIRTMASSSTLFPVPDYVANYIRGDTPEMVAERREERSRRGQQRFPQIREGSMDVEEGREGELYGPRGSRHMLPGYLGGDQALTDQDGNHGHTGADGGARSLLSRIRGWMPSGWRGTLTWTLVLNGLLIALLVATIVVVALEHGDAFWTTESTIVTKSSCRTIRAANQGTHAAAATLGVLLITGALHASQVLAAPSRANLDSAHGDGQWVDIGRGLSIKNLRIVNMARVLLSFVVIVAATGTLVAFNALIFTTKLGSSDELDKNDSSSCSLTLDGALLGVLLIFLVVYAGVLIVTLCRPGFRPLLTLGDAIASLMSRPDSANRISAISVNSTGATSWDGRDTPARQALVGDKNDTEMVEARWMASVSRTRWVLWLTSWIIPFALALVSLGFSVSGKHSSIPAFGRSNWIHETPVDSSRSALVILVSLPQILIAILYLSTSSLFSAFFSARELAGYDAAARAAAGEGGVVRLRVSAEKVVGMQTTSWYITLPPFVSIMLFAVFVAMSFFVNQSLTLIAIGRGDSKTMSAIGLSPLPLISLAGILVALGVTVLCISFFCRTEVPREAKGSRTIASWCQHWNSGREEMQEQQPHPGLNSQGERVVSWGGMSAAQGTISSGQWMAAGR